MARLSCTNTQSNATPPWRSGGLDFATRSVYRCYNGVATSRDDSGVKERCELDRGADATAAQGPVGPVEAIGGT